LTIGCQSHYQTLRCILFRDTVYKVTHWAKTHNAGASHKLVTHCDTETAIGRAKPALFSNTGFRFQTSPPVSDFIDCLEKVYPLMFDNDFGNRFSKFFHQLIHKKFSMCTPHIFPLHMQYVATLPCEI